MVQNTTLIQLTVRCRQHMVLAHRYIAHVAGQRVFLFCVGRCIRSERIKLNIELILLYEKVLRFCTV